MQLKTKLVLSVTALTFAIVLILCSLFMGQLLRQRIEQTAASNDVLAQQVLLMTRQAVETGIRENPPVDRSDEALHAAVVDALRSSDALTDVMNAVVRYSPTVQDVSVTDAHGLTLVSTDPDSLDQEVTFRTSLKKVRDSGFVDQMRELFGKPRVLDLTQSLDRNGAPFLAVHVGVRSTFLRNSYEEWLRSALWFALIAGVASIVGGWTAGEPGAAAYRADQHAAGAVDGGSGAGVGTGRSGSTALEAGEGGSDAMVRVTKTIERLGEQMRTKEAGYSGVAGESEPDAGYSAGWRAAVYG